jgi:hypothetical protein
VVAGTQASPVPQEISRGGRALDYFKALQFRAIEQFATNRFDQFIRDCERSIIDRKE